MIQEEERSHLKQIIGDRFYKPASKLSYGSYGQIFKIVNTKDQTDYVLKVVSKDKMIKQNKLHQAVIQGYLLSKFNHPNIIKYYDTIQTKQYICQILQFCPYGDFFNLMKKINKNLQLNEKKSDIVLFYLAQIVAALSYLHSLQIVHRDIKPQNLVIDENMHIRLIDFGTAKTLDNSIMYNKKQIQLIEKIRTIKTNQTEDEQEIARRGSFVGSANYISPQSIKMNHSLSSDIWSLGVIIYKIFHNKLPFEGENNYLIFKNIKSSQYKIDETLSQEIKDLIAICLIKDPEERPSIQFIKKHKYFESIDFENLHKLKPPLNEKDLRLTQVIVKPVKSYKMQIVLQKQMFFGNYKPRILKMYDRQNKLYMSYWYLDKNVPKNQFQIKINDYSQAISDNEFTVKNDDVKYTFRVGTKHNVHQVANSINSIVRQFYNLE